MASSEKRRLQRELLGRSLRLSLEQLESVVQQVV
jgi:hypothetical protein